MTHGLSQPSAPYPVPGHAPDQASAQPPRSRFSLPAFLVLATSIIGILMQMWLVWLGADITLGPTDPTDPNGVSKLIVWCSIATLYLMGTTITLTFMARSPLPDSPLTRRVIGHPLTRLLAIVFTFGASLIGLVVAVEIITDLGLDVRDSYLEAVGIWAMLLSWVLFNWGYARIYFSLYHRAKTAPLQFPGTPEPKLVDFAYLSFTNATNFSVSDVQVLSTHMRWTVVWHTTVAFFFNALIIGLIINVLANGKLFAAIFA